MSKGITDSNAVKEFATDYIHSVLNLYPEWYSKDYNAATLTCALIAQMEQESQFKPDAVSPAGAKGLMQVMPHTAKEVEDKHSLLLDSLGFDDEESRHLRVPTFNIVIGMLYFLEQLKHFPEVKMPLERLKFAWASYNCGRGYVNAALRAYRQDYPAARKAQRAKKPYNYLWKKMPFYLRIAKVRGKTARYEETLPYVEKIRRNYKRNVEDPQWQISH